RAARAAAAADAGAPRRAPHGRLLEALARDAGGGARKWPARFFPAAPAARRRRADGRGARGGGGSAARRALPLLRSGPLLARPRREGRPSIPRSAEGLRPHHLGPQTGGLRGATGQDRKE